MTLWPEPLLFAAAYLLLALGILGWQRTIVGRAETGQKMPAPRLLSAAFIIHCLLPFVCVLFLGQNVSLTFASWDEARAGFLLNFLGPVLAVQFWFYSRITTGTFRLAGRLPDRRELRLIRLRSLHAALLLALFLRLLFSMAAGRPQLREALPEMALLLAGAGITRFLMQGHLAVTARPPGEMEDTPLRGDFLAVAARFGWSPETVGVRKIRSRVDGELHRTDLAGDLRVWWIRFNPRRPSVPLQLLQAVDPSVVTAVLAARYAQVLDPYPLGARGLRRSPLTGPAVVFALVTGLGLILGALYLPVRLFPAAAGLVLLFPAAGLVAAFYRRRHALPRAYDCWKTITGAEEDSAPEKFVGALFQYDWLQSGLASPGVMVTFYRQSGRITRFLKRFPPDTQTRVWDEVRRTAEELEAAKAEA